MERCRKWSLLCLIVAGVMLVGCSRKNDEAANSQPPTPTTQPNDPLSTALESGLPVLAEFGRGICIPCKMMKPVLDSVSAEFQGRAVVLTVEIDRYMDLSRKLRITLIPTQIFFDEEGGEVYRHQGFMPKQDVVEQLSKLCREKVP